MYLYKSFFLCPLLLVCNEYHDFFFFFLFVVWPFVGGRVVLWLRCVGNYAQKNLTYFSYSSERRENPESLLWFGGTLKLVVTIEFFTLSLGLLSPPIPSFSGIYKVKTYFDKSQYEMLILTRFMPIHKMYAMTLAKELLVPKKDIWPLK